MLKLDYATMTPFEYGNRMESWISINKSVVRHSVNCLLGRSGKWRSRGHLHLFQRFIQSIDNDSDPPVTGHDGRETTRILEMMLKQMKFTSKQI
jgi:hypothetical protein